VSTDIGNRSATAASTAASSTAYLVVAGDGVVVGKQPDGDSVRFLPADATLLGQLENGHRVHPSADGTVQLRFDGVDAPELHYQGHAQPRGDSARDDLLEHLGFTDLTYAGGGETVSGAEPATVPLVILSRLVEVNGRPVSVVFSGDAAARLASCIGTRVELTPGLLAESVNAWEAASGVVYPLLYTSTDPALRQVFIDLARTARDQQLGVWASDSSDQFSVADAAALGPHGALVLPKLFRRVVDYLRQRTAGQTVPDWLAAHPDTEDDQVIVAGAPAQPLHTLLTHTADTVTVTADVLDLVFVER
jgi:endonuclease YncB( thermonuclease family)